VRRAARSAGADPVRGPYITNTEIGRVISAMLQR